MLNSRRPASVAFGFALTTLLIAGTAVAGVPSGVKDDPQPELAPFNVAASSASGLTTAMESNGTELLAYYPHSEKATELCILPRADRKCSHITNIPSPGASPETGTPQVFAAGTKDVGLILDNAADGEEYYTSTNGGLSFGTPTAVGANTIDIDESVLAGSNIAFTDAESNDGLQVASFSAISPVSNAPVVVNANTVYETGMSTYKGGVLVAGQDGSSTVTVYYAKAGSDLNLKASYLKVGTFANSEISGMSGSALVTIQTTGSNHFQLRLFNGTSFGSTHNLPKIHSTLGNWGTTIQDSRGVTHVFDEAVGTAGIDSDRYYEFSTTSGATWSTQELPGNGATWTYDSSVLDKNGSGILAGNNGAGSGAPVHVWPVLQVAPVSFSIAHASIKKGHSVKASGKGRPAATGRTVVLQKLEGKLWRTVKTTHESASGAFSFTIKGSSVGKFTYRAATADKAGYVQYGYSSGRNLTVKKPHS